MSSSLSFPVIPVSLRKDASASPFDCTLTGIPCGHAEALRPMEGLAGLRIIHNWGFCHLRAKFPALRIFMFYARFSSACFWCRHCRISFRSAYKRNMKIVDRAHPTARPTRPSAQPRHAAHTSSPLFFQFSHKSILDKLSIFSVVK